MWIPGFRIAPLLILVCCKNWTSGNKDKQNVWLLSVYQVDTVEFKKNPFDVWNISSNGLRLHKLTDQSINQPSNPTRLDPTQSPDPTQPSHPTQPKQPNTTNVSHQALTASATMMFSSNGYA